MCQMSCVSWSRVSLVLSLLLALLLSSVSAAHTIRGTPNRLRSQQNDGRVTATTSLTSFKGDVLPTATKGQHKLEQSYNLFEDKEDLVASKEQKQRRHLKGRSKGITRVGGGGMRIRRPMRVRAPTRARVRSIRRGSTPMRGGRSIMRGRSPMRGRRMMRMRRMRRMMRMTVTSAPVTRRPTSAPGVTPAPTLQSTPTTPTTTPAPTTPAGTTPTPTTPAPTTPGATTTPAPTAPTASCTSNPQDYNVNVDVQIQFVDDEFAACDSEEQDSAINTNIQAALNENFATTVTDWAGTATFGEFVFDIDQEINNVDPFGGFRRLQKLIKTGGLRPDRVLRHQYDHQAHLVADGHNEQRIRHLAQSLANFPIQQRNLQTGTCPTRAAVDCTADYCRWGCLTASTTDCGDPASTTASWTNLAGDIRDRLANLGFDCLGIPEDLQVVLVVDDPNGIVRSGTTATTRAATTTPLDGVGVTTLDDEVGNATTPDDGGITALDEVDVDVGTPDLSEVATRSGGPIETIDLKSFAANLKKTTAATSTADDLKEIETLPVASKLVFNFFPGRGREPLPTEINSLVKETEAFFRRTFQSNDQFSKVFKDFQMAHTTPIYNSETDPDEFTLEFMGLVLLDATASNTTNKSMPLLSDKQALNVMSKSSFKDYIGKYVRQSSSPSGGPVQWNEFYQTHVVHFTGAAGV